MGQGQCQHKQPTHSTTTYAKSQVLAILSASVSSRRAPKPTLSGSPLESPQSLFRWVQSTALVRAWANDWVLRPDRFAVFQLPIHNHFLYVSVSATLGLVGSYWFTGRGWVRVLGCVGDGLLLVQPQGEYTEYARVKEYMIVDVSEYCNSGAYCGSSTKGAHSAHRVMASMRAPRVPMWCNENWIVGLYSWEEMRVWKVGGRSGGSVIVSEGVQIKGIDAMNLQFSPLCADVVMTFSSTAQPRGFVTFIDLEASFNSKRLVVKSTVKCFAHLPFGILWMPDGSTCTLHCDDSSFILLRDTTTGNPVKLFPKQSNVVPVDPHHIFAITRPFHTELEVFSASNLATPSLHVPCTWASASVPSGLILSTSHHEVRDRNMTEIYFTLHDSVTGFHVGDFSIPLPHPGELELFW